MTPRVSSSVFITLSSSLVVLIVIFPWILGVITIFGLLGYFYLDIVNEKLKQFLQENQIFLTKSDNIVELKSDPLLNIKPSSAVGLPSSPSPTCSVCSLDSCTRDGESGHHHRSHSHSSSRKNTPSPKHSPAATPTPIPTSYDPPVSANDLKIDLRLDAAISRFCTSVFDFYISRHWAPHETRKQLKLAFKKLLTNFAERVKSRLILVNEKGEQTVEKFCREKLIPLFLYHIQETTKPSNRAANLCELEKKQARTKLKVRVLCRQVLEKCLSEEDLHCKLWMELCVSVLSDGVLWNLIKLGKDEIPELVENAIGKLYKSFGAPKTSVAPKVSAHVRIEEEPAPRQSPPRQGTPSEGEDTVDTLEHPLRNSATPPRERDQSEERNNQSTQPQQSKVNETKKEDVPFLLDSYLDPVNDIDQPDDIASRWRPKLQDILEERELLYCLIQYLKGHKALEYLQAVLDDAADAKDYCRKILELEYMPCFCRSSPFLEKMGLSRVDAGFEPAADTHSNGSSSSRPNSGHTRSASFGGGGNSGLQILKFEQGVVDGLPLYQTPSTTPSISSGLSSGFVLPGAGTMEPDFVFKKKPTTTLESTVSKFFSSTLSPPRHAVDVLCDRPDAAKRVGVDSKLYDDYSHDEVNMSVVITQCDILEASTEAVTSSISLNPWVGPILSGWLQLLHPYIKPHFDSFLEQKLNDFLTIELFIDVVELISDAFLQKNVADEAESNLEAASDSELPREINSNENSWISLFEKYMVTHVLDLEFFAKSLNRNKDNITAFFVDVLDVFVSEIS